MIYTITLNPSIDQHITIEKLIKDDAIRAKHITRDPGTKGINVSRVVKELGGQIKAFAIIGGCAGYMNTINIRRFGLASGVTFALLYLGCMPVMAAVGKEGTIFFFNSLMHGVDVTSIVRMNMPLGEAGMGIIEIFILGWLLGATLASIYNFGLKKQKI